METPYSQLLHSPSIPNTLFSTSTETVGNEESGISTPKRSFMMWASSVWALIVHFILSVTVAIFVLAYVAGHHFNITERTPLVQIVEGTRASPFLLMQTDVVTLLSSLLAVLKIALSSWVALLSWNIALFLMERRGLARRDLKILLDYGLLAPGAYSRDWTSVIIGALLIVSLIANLASPLLTGSISWVPNNRLVQGLSIEPLQFGDALDGSIRRLQQGYSTQAIVREKYSSRGVGLIGISWGRDVDKGVLKRVSDLVVGLAVNSTVENLTLPFFQVHSIRWIENRDEIPGIRDGLAPIQILKPQFQMAPVMIQSFSIGYVALVPNVTTNWSSDPLESTTIHDTRLLMLLYGVEYTSGEHFNLTISLPPSAYTQSYDGRHHAFAWVTFSAGVGYCKDYNCAVSSPSTIRNTKPIEISPHQLTFQALSLAPVLAVHLVDLNNSIPYMWGSINDYVEAVLVRSYSGAWLSLNGNMILASTSARYIPSLPSLLAVVDRARVYIWLVIQLLVTLLSAHFLIVQSRESKYPLMVDISLIAFELDTTALTGEHPATEVRKVERKGSRWAVKVE